MWSSFMYVHYRLSVLVLTRLDVSSNIYLSPLVCLQVVKSVILTLAVVITYWMLICTAVPT